jgi:hypothetical protein
MAAGVRGTPFHTYGNASNPANPNFLDKGLSLWPSAIAPPQRTGLFAHAERLERPEFINLKLNGDIDLMPSAFPPGFVPAVFSTRWSRQIAPSPRNPGPRRRGSMIITPPARSPFFDGGPPEPRTSYSQAR